MMRKSILISLLGLLSLGLTGCHDEEEVPTLDNNDNPKVLFDDKGEPYVPNDIIGKYPFKSIPKLWPGIKYEVLDAALPIGPWKEVTNPSLMGIVNPSLYLLDEEHIIIFNAQYQDGKAVIGDAIQVPVTCDLSKSGLSVLYDGKFVARCVAYGHGYSAGPGQGEGGIFYEMLFRAILHCALQDGSYAYVIQGRDSGTSPVADLMKTYREAELRTLLIDRVKEFQN